MYLQRCDLVCDQERMFQDYNNITSTTPWLPFNQIGLNSRIGASDIWKDAAGSLYDRKTNVQLGQEQDFTNWNVDNYMRQQIELLAASEKIKIGRVRLMKLLPKTGLSVHKDAELRYHYVFQTNSKSYFCFNERHQNENSVFQTVAVCYHIPKDGMWYRVDTTKVHWVYNGGDTDRVHLVVCGI